MNSLKKSIILSIIFSQTIFLLLFPLFPNLIFYLHPIVLGVVWACLTAFVVFLVFWIRKEIISIPYYLLLGFLILYTISLLVLLFFRPHDQSYSRWNLEPFSTILYYLSGEVEPIIAFYNLVANIGLFIPYGIFLMIRSKHAYLSGLQLLYVPLLFISFIEFMQFLTHRGSLDIDDLILNMLGICLGYLLFPLFKRVVQIC